MKNSKFRKYGTCIFMAIAVLVMMSSQCMKVHATENVSVTRVAVERYEVTNEKIIPGEDFTLKLFLKNYNTAEAAKNVIVDIDNPDGVAPVYGTVSQIFAGNIGPGETKEIAIDYNSWTSITEDTLDFYVTLIADNSQNYNILRIPVGVDSPFSILALNMPENAVANEAFSCSVTFRVLGDENVSDVTAHLDVNGEEVVKSAIGSLTAGTTKTQTLSFIFDNSGEHALELKVSYTDADGQKETVSIGNFMLSVAEQGDSQISSDISQNITEENPGGDATNIMLMAISGILILVIFLVVVIIMRKHK